MNLDDLKSAWQAVNAQQLSEQRVSAAEVRRIIRSRSTSLLERINRTILLEVLASILLATGGCTYLFLLDDHHLPEIAFLGVYFLAVLVFYYYKYRALNLHELTEESLTTSLRHLVHRTQQFLRIYHYMIVVGVPLGALIGFAYGLYYAQRDGHPLAENLTTKVVAFAAAALVIVGGFWILLSKWYVNRIYGKPFRDLQDCLAELEESER